MNELSVKQVYQEISTLKNIVAPDATDEELVYFAKFCHQVGLNPIANQIHFVKRAGRSTFQTSIDGFRIIAERSSKYQGQTKVEFGEIKRNKFKLMQKKQLFEFDLEYPEWAEVGIYRKDFACPLYARAYFDEYCPNPLTVFWKKMPRIMIAKCAEALALRKAFPNDLSNIYTNDELDQAEYQESAIIESKPNNFKKKDIKKDDAMTEKQFVKIYSFFDNDKEKLLTYCKDLDINLKKFSRKQASQLIESLEANK